MSKKTKSEPSVGAWVVTFADLMSLLMCFFVLLLSFAELDAKKYKQIAGAMKEAFGVQRQIKTYEVPKGVSFLPQYFTPGEPVNKPLNQIQQQTTLDSRKELGKPIAKREIVNAKAKKISQALEKEINDGKLEIETLNNKIIIRLQAENTFQSGNDKIATSFKPILEKLSKAMADIKGSIDVAGHTDNYPISTERFRSNWDLSTARAVSVAHELMKEGRIRENRFKIIGYADTKPRLPNSTAKNRAKNRRVEITIEQKQYINKDVPW